MTEKVTKAALCKKVVSARLITLAADDGTHAKRSGYSVLAEYLKGAERITAFRASPRGLFRRAIVGVVNRFSFTRWYWQSSAEMEWKAWRRLRDFSGIIHVMWADRDLGFLDLLLDRYRHRLCATFHSCPDTLSENIHFPSRLLNLDAAIMMSEIQRPFFEAHGMPPDRIHVIHHGVDTQFFHPHTKTASQDRFEVLSVGSYRRNFEALRAVCRLMSKDESVHFKIVAPERFQNMFAGLANVTFLSDLCDRELLETYRKASCFLFTAEAATANNGVLEAMASGVPIVSEAVGGIPEYVAAGCGLLTTPGVPEELAEAVRRLAGDPETCSRLGLNARRRAEELDWSRVAERTYRVYDAISK